MLRRINRAALSKLGMLIAILMAAAVLVAVFGIVIRDGSSASGEGAQENMVAAEPADSVVIRVYGTQGLPFGGSYATILGGQKRVEGELGLQPIEYEVPAGFGDGYASFQKQATEGELKAEILVNGQVVKERKTDAEYGLVTMFYSLQDSPDRPRHPLEPSIPLRLVLEKGESSTSTR